MIKKTMISMLRLFFEKDNLNVLGALVTRNMVFNALKIKTN